MREVGRIVSINDNDAVVRIQASDGCKSCQMGSCCHVAGPGNREVNLPLGDLQCAVGEWVEIDTSARSVLTAAVLVFILPLVLSTAAYLIVQSVFQKPNIAVASFFGCFVLSEALVALIDHLFGRRRFFRPRIHSKVSGPTTEA